jgi:hypothetical protein
LEVTPAVALFLLIAALIVVGNRRLKRWSTGPTTRELKNLVNFHSYCVKVFARMNVKQREHTVAEATPANRIAEVVAFMMNSHVELAEYDKKRVRDVLSEATV